MSSKIILKPKRAVLKPVRLLDFNIYDEKTEKDDSSSSENESVEKPSYEKKTDNSEFVIQMFGIDESGDTYSLFVKDFQPFFFIKVGDKWTQNMVNALAFDIRKKLGKYYEESIESATLVEYNKLYGFSAGKKDRFAQFVFKNSATMNKTKNLWFEYLETETGERIRKSKKMIFEKTELILYESSIPPLLRFFHIQNISPSGWVAVSVSKCTKIMEKTTTCTHEYNCLTAYIKPMPEKETRVPYKICSFDIEASSSHGDFPLPKKTYKRLAMNMVDVFSRHTLVQKLDKQQSNDLYKKMIQSAFGYGRCDDIDLVYPKVVPSKERILSLIASTLQTPVDDIDSDEAAELLTINSMFQKMNETISNTSGCGKEDGEEDDDADIGGDGEITPMIMEDELDDSEHPDNTMKLRRPRKKSTSKITIVDVLMNPEHDRELKIQTLDKVLTSTFPHLKGDEVTFIGSTFMRYGESEPYLNHCAVLGSCESVDGVTIETAETEREVLLKWTDLIQRENPDIIIGYNIFGFDYEFMFQRSMELGCAHNFLLLSRKIGDMSAKVNRETGTIAIENTKIQLATGEYDLRYFKMAGRLQIDMYTYFRRDFNLSSYKLDDVAGQFISDSVQKVVHIMDDAGIPMTELYSQNLMGLHAGDFIHIELGGFTSDYYKDGKKFIVKDIVKGREITEHIKGKETTVKYNVIVIMGHEDIHSVAAGKSIKWGMAKDDVTPQDIFRLSKGSAADRAIVAKYCIQDCNLVHHLMNKIDVITGYVEMSSICSVPISFLVFRGQGIKLTSYVAKKCREKQTLMPDLDKSGANEGYEGAIVLPPKCSMYMDNPVACVDYASLYPSSMISQNFSHDSKVWSKEYDLQGRMVRETGDKDRQGRYIYDNLPGYEYIDIEFDTFKYLRNPARPAAKATKTKVGKMVCRWAQFPENRKGIMPSILEELLKARANTRKMAKTEKDPFMQNILDKRQLGYKVTANSLYGQCGAKTSTFYEKDVAACTTATGRMMITYAKRIIEEVYGDRVYETAIHGPVRTKAEYVYGDSVANYTPVYVRHNGQMHICTIEELAGRFGNGQWQQCREEGKQNKEYCTLSGVETWSDSGWTPLLHIIRHKLAKHKQMYRIKTKTAIVDVTDDHSLLRTNGEKISPKQVSIGTELMHRPLPTVSPLQMYSLYPMHYPLIYSNQLEAATVFCKLQSKHGYNNYSIGETNLGVYHIYPIDSDMDSTGSNRLTNIIDMYPIPYDGYVYDLTTENHHFAAGIGNMIVHNTDSVFFTFNLENPNTGEKIRGKPALEMTIEIAQDAADLCTQFLKPPMELTYEKTLMPFILLSKKRYVGMLYENDANKGKLKYMGLSLKRRDSCDYLKDVYGGILNILMKENSVQKAIDYLEGALTELVKGNVAMDKLTITKALRGDYKNPQQIAHRVLADRIGQRDPGNKPKPGDRMKFVHIVNDMKKALQGEKIETPEYILANKLQVDYVFYITNQLMKPIQQLFGLALEQIWLNRGKHMLIKTFKKDMQALNIEVDGDIETFMKKKEKYCSAKIKALLFDKFLTSIYNEKHKIQTITSFFPAKR
jgi:DNA polymerase elongation subunit (family B)